MSTSLGWGDALWLARRRTPNDRLRFWGSMLSSAIAAALLCTAIGLIALRGAPVVASIQVVAEPGTRGGTAFAVLLVALPALYLTGQTWKLGSIERRERMRQLRDAGAGVNDLRRVAMADTLVPVLIGAVAGVVLLGVALGLLNARGSYLPGYLDTPDGGVVPSGTYVLQRGMPVVPNVVTAAWWATLLAVALVALGAAAAAARAVSRVDEPETRTRAPRTWSGALAKRTGRPDLLLALRRLSDEPGPTTRPALLLGLAAIVAGASVWLSRQYRLSLGRQWLEDDFFSQSFDLIRLATWVGVGLCALGLVVALADAVVRRRRADAAAVASGVPLGVLRRALVLQTLVPAVPAVLGGLVLGGGLAVAFTGPQIGNRFAEPGLQAPLVPFPWLLWLSWAVGILVVAVCAALLASTALSRTTRTDQLRVPA